MAVIGGDKREKVLVEKLLDKGYSISVLSDSNFNNDNVKVSVEMKKVVENADVVLASMSSTDEKGFLKSTFIDEKIKLDEDFFELLSQDALFLIGIAVPKIKSIMDDRNIQYIELARLDNLAIMNAIPTAEGAIKIAIEETEITLYNSRIIIYGLGKVGFALAWRLKMLGAEVFAVTRDKTATARGHDLGIKMLTYQELNKKLPDIDIIYNTVPARIIDAEAISLLKKDTIIIDLASSPGGTDFEIANEMGIKAILALGLPGKIAPITAGMLLADIIPDLISE
ncbi:MAG: dipicolinate synthase subunit DpsA [Halanaerobiaceae bacterium]